jgi:hypothetical protein
MSSVIVHPDFGGGAHEPFDGEEAEVRCGGCMQKRVGNQSCRMIHARRSKVQRRGSLQLGGRGNAVEPTWRRAMQVHVQSHGGGAIIRDVGDEAVQRDYQRGRRGRRSRGGKDVGSRRGAGLGHQRGGCVTARRHDSSRGVMFTPGR